MYDLGLLLVNNFTLLKMVPKPQVISLIKRKQVRDRFYLFDYCLSNCCLINDD